jgi:hypothetical protein
MQPCYQGRRTPTLMRYSMIPILFSFNKQQAQAFLAPSSALIQYSLLALAARTPVPVPAVHFCSYQAYVHLPRDRVLFIYLPPLHHQEINTQILLYIIPDIHRIYIYQYVYGRLSQLTQ